MRTLFWIWGPEERFYFFLILLFILYKFFFFFLGCCGCHLLFIGFSRVSFYFSNCVFCSSYSLELGFYSFIQFERSERASGGGHIIKALTSNPTNHLISLVFLTVPCNNKQKKWVWNMVYNKGPSWGAWRDWSDSGFIFVYFRFLSFFPVGFARVWWVLLSLDA